MELKSVADMVGDLVHPVKLAPNSTRLARAKPVPALTLSPNSRNSTGQPLAGTEADDFWCNLTARIDEIDALINQLCDLRNDSDEHRADLLAVRKRMAPVHLDVDIRYLLEEIERATPASLPEPTRDCRDCEHHRGRAHLRYCLNPDGVVQRDDALASPIVDCSIASRCQAFKKITPTTQKPRRYRKPLDRVIAHRNPIHFFERYP